MLIAENEKRELLPSQKAAMNHAGSVSPLSKEQAEEMVAKLCELDFVTTPVAYKIADLRPKYSNDVRAIFSKERVTLDGDMIQSVLDIVSSY
jgi:DNA-directed RNA polymerase subunit F